MAAFFPSSLATLRSNYVNGTDHVDAGEENQRDLEINAIEATLGLGMLSSTWAGTFNGSTSTWSSVSARLANIEAGITKSVKYGASNNLINIAAGAAPGSPAAGDLYTTSAGLFYSSAAANARRVPTTSYQAASAIITAGGAAPGSYGPANLFTSAPVVAGRTYKVRLQLVSYSVFVGGGTIAGGSVVLTYPSLTAGNVVQQGPAFATIALTGTSATLLASPAANGAVSVFEGFITPSASGTINVQASTTVGGSSGSGGTGTAVGSSLEITEVA